MTVLINGTGSFLPEPDALRCAPDELATSDLATRAAELALADARTHAGDVEVIVLATCTSDYIQPPTAALLQANLKTKAKYVQLDTGCSGFVEAMLIANALLAGGQYRTALVVAADTLSRICDPHSRVARETFGDGAGAVLLSRREPLDGYGVGAFISGSDVAAYEHAGISAGGSRRPYSREAIERHLHRLSCDYPRAEAWATARMHDAVRGVLVRAGLSLSEIDWVLPQQTSARVGPTLASALELPPARFIETFAEAGNTASSSIPIALDHAKRRRVFRHGDRLVLPAAGTGTGWGAFVYRWYDPS